MSYFYITYLEPLRTDNVIAPDIAEYDFETYRKLNNFCEVKIQEVKAPNINKALEMAYNAHNDKTNPFVEKPSTNVKDRDITALRESVRGNILKSYDTNTTDDEIINFLKTLNINNPCNEDTVTDTDNFYQNLVRVKDPLEAENYHIYTFPEPARATTPQDAKFINREIVGKALSQRDIVLINNVYKTVLNKIPEDTQADWNRICEKYNVLFNLKDVPDDIVEFDKTDGDALITFPDFDDSVKDLVKSYQSFIEYSINFIEGNLDYGAEKVALTQYLLDFAYDIFIGDNQGTFNNLPRTYVPGIKDNKLAVITSFMIKLKLRYQAMNLENKKNIVNNAINDAYKTSGLALGAGNNGEKRLKFCLKLFNIPEIEVQDWKYGTPSSFIQLAPYFYGSSVATNYSQNMITFSRTQSITTLSKGDGKCKYGRGWLNQWNREVFENRQKLVNAIRQGADVSQNKKVKGLDVYFIDDGNLELTKEKFPNIICVMQSTVALCSSDVIAPPVASGQGPTLLKMGQPLYTATNNANPAFLHTKDELLSMWKYYWSGKCNLKYSIPITAMTICGDSSRQPCGIGGSGISEDQLNSVLYRYNKVTNVQDAIDKSKSAIENAIKNMPNLTDMDYKYVEYRDPEREGAPIVAEGPALVPGAGVPGAGVPGAFLQPVPPPAEPVLPGEQ